MHGWIVTGGVIFWILLGIEGIAMILLMPGNDGEDEQPRSGSGTGITISLAIFLAILFIFGDWSFRAFLAYVASHTGAVAGLVALYLVIGIPWSLWYAYYSARIRGNAYRLARMEWLREQGIKGDSIPDEMLTKWSLHVEKDYRLSKFRDAKTRGQIFSARRGRIVASATYWPMSMAWFFLADLCIQIFDFVCMQLRSTYQRIMDFAFRDIAHDFRKAEKDTLDA